MLNIKKLLAVFAAVLLTATANAQITGGGSGGVVVGNAVTGGNAYAVLTEDGSQNVAAGTGLKFGGAAAGTGLAIVAGTATTGVNGLNVSQTWNNGSQIFAGAVVNITPTAYAASSLLQTWQLAGVDHVKFRVNSGTVGLTLGATGVGFGALEIVNGSGGRLISIGADVAGIAVVSGDTIGFSSSATEVNSGFDAAFRRGGPNQLVFSTGVGAGGAVTRTEINKSVTAIADNVATAVNTVTVPNGAHSAGGKLVIKCSAGVGGAIGANEFTAANEYDWVVARTAGVNAVATLSTAFLTTITASVAGAATPTLSVALSAIAGAVGATNTFTFNATVHALTGSSTNHTCFTYVTLLNDNASGVTIQ